MIYDINMKSQKCEKQRGENMVNVNKLKGLIVEKETTQEALAKEAGICRATFYRRMDNPETFKIGEIQSIVSSLGMTNQQAIEIFLGKESQKCENCS